MLQKARPRPDFRYTDFLVSASAQKKKRNDDLNFSKARRKKNTGVHFGDPLFEEKTRKKKENDQQRGFFESQEYFRALLRNSAVCRAARRAPGMLWGSKYTGRALDFWPWRNIPPARNIPPPRGRYLPNLPYLSHLE